MREKRKKRERRAILILALLGLILTGTAYYFQIYRPVEMEIKRLREERQETEQRLLEAQAELIRLKQMEDDIHERYAGAHFGGGGVF